MKVTNVMAASVDGFVATHEGQTDADRHSQGFTNEADWKNLLKLISGCDAVILGSKTLIAGGGVLNQTRKDGTWPIWVTLTNKGIPHGNEFWNQTRAERWLVSEKPLQLPEPSTVYLRNVRNLVYGQVGGKEVVRFVLDNLRQAGCTNVLLLGGGGVNRMFYEAEAVDELALTICPVLVARDGAVPLVNHSLPQPVSLTLSEVRVDGDLVFTRYMVNPGNSPQ
jgi:riboflavin biosynthesis pyrimidine reductase